MNAKQIEDEQKMLDFAVKANVILWEGPETESRLKLVEKFGDAAKSKTLVVLFHGIKSAFKQMEKEVK
jgi:hypothetical protein